MASIGLMSTKPITKVRFSISGDVDNEKDSYVAIEHFDMFKNNIPYPGGIYDAGLGTTDYSYRCNTCRNDKEKCIGHEGHHRLNYPVKQPIFEADIIKWLNVICFKCGMPVISNEKISTFGKKNTLREAYNFTKTSSRKCYWCSSKSMYKTDNKKGGNEESLKLLSDTTVSHTTNISQIVKKDKNGVVRITEEPILIGAVEWINIKEGSGMNTEDIINIIKDLHPQVKKDKLNPYIYKAQYTDKDQLLHEELLYPHKIAEIFSRISDNTVRMLGRDPLSHPKKLIISTIKIPPSAIRPDTRRFGGMRVGKNNELSTPIQYIIKKNLKIPVGFIGDDKKYLASIEKLNEHYYDFVKGASAAVGKGNASAQQNKSLGNSLVGKKGLIRKHHLGKRVHKMIRSTITCNPTLKIDEVGIPLSFARNMQIEEVLQPYNKDRLMVYFNNGRKKYPGCTMIKKKNIPEPFSIENIKEDFIFEYGDIIYRDLIDGDYFLFNRQPSLHFSSIGCHKMVINQDPSGSTLEFNVICCPWYNADFKPLESTVSVLCGWVSTPYRVKRVSMPTIIKLVLL